MILANNRSQKIAAIAWDSYCSVTLETEHISTYHPRAFQKFEKQKRYSKYYVNKYSSLQKKYIYHRDQHNTHNNLFFLATSVDT